MITSAHSRRKYRSRSQELTFRPYADSEGDGVPLLHELTRIALPSPAVSVVPAVEFDTDCERAKVLVVAGIFVLLRDESSHPERHFAGATYNELDRPGHHD